MTTSTREFIEYKLYGVWVSGGERGHWLPDPLNPLETFRTPDRQAAQALVGALRSETESYIVCGIRENEL